jgi:DUF1365 family protein
MVSAPAFQADPPALPALVVGVVSHTRHRPLRSSFTHRNLSWLIDLDAPPRLPRGLGALARFEARDHFEQGTAGQQGEPAGPAGIRQRLGRFLAGHGIVLHPQDRVIMLAHPRTLGHVFNPLSTFWCLAPDGSVRALVLEVHNTYGRRHAYLVELDDTGRPRSLAKEFYVSPFNEVSGQYDIQARLTPGLVHVAIRLDRDGQRILTAVTRGQPRPATTRAVLAQTLRHTVMTYRVSALIRIHGVALWLRRLPVVPRDPQTSPPEVDQAAPETGPPPTPDPGTRPGQPVVTRRS